MYLGVALLGSVLLVWSCDNTNTGGLRSPCSSNSECASGLVCAVGRCSDRSAGSQCDEDNQCIEGLICNGSVCGGTAGDICQSDAGCIPGLICVTVGGASECAPRGDGGEGSRCGRGGHCISGSCPNGLCGRAGGLDSLCGTDPNRNRGCEGDYVCIGTPMGTETDYRCREKQTQDGACNNDDHCLGSLVCRDNVCSRDERAGCSDDSQCVPGFICAGRFPVCVVPGDGGAGSVCRISDDHCDMNLPCVLGACSDGSIGSRCIIGDDCTGTLLCGNNVCGRAARSSCSNDDQCAGSLICAGPTAELTCAQSNGLLGDACRANIGDHCVGDLVCSSGGRCRVARDNACTEDSHCTDNLLCIGVMGNKVCGSTDGMIGDACGIDNHCADPLTCSSGECRVTLGNICAADEACTDPLVCQFGQSTQPRVCTQVGTGAVGSVCRSDAQCDGANVICAGDTGNQICAPIGDGSVGSVCGTSANCNPTLVCHINACAVTGTTWVSRQSNLTSELIDVHYENSLWVAVGGTADSGDVTTSTDGTVWTSQTGVDDGRLNAVDYGNGPFLGSADQWTTVSSSGNITSSTNGTTWGTPVAALGSDVILNDIIYDRRWMAVGSELRGSSRIGHIVQPSSNFGWDSLLDVPTNALNAVHSTGSLMNDPIPWVAVGENGLIATSRSETNVVGNTVLVGQIWRTQTSGVTSNLVDVFFGGRSWAAVSGDGHILTSSNGIAWTAQLIADTGIADVHYDNSLWVAVGSDTGDGSVFIATSGDGTTWGELDTTADGGVDGTLNAVHYAAGLWVAVGTGGIVLTSTDGATWTAQTSNVTNELLDIHHDNSRWVAVGVGGAITTSPTR